QRDQRRALGSGDKGAVCEPRRGTDADDAGRVRDLHSERNREVGQGRQDRAHQGGLKLSVEAHHGVGTAVFAGARGRSFLAPANLALWKVDGSMSRSYTIAGLRTSTERTRPTTPPNISSIATSARTKLSTGRVRAVR